jgi:hypothetical protein
MSSPVTGVLPVARAASGRDVIVDRDFAQNRTAIFASRSQ